MHSYTNLDAVLNYITPAVRKEDSDMNLLSLALQGFKQLKTQAALHQDVQVLPIIDHKVDLPEGLMYIDLVTWMCELPCKEEQVKAQCDLPCYSCGEKLIECGTPGIYYSGIDAYCGSCDKCITEPETFYTRTNNICRHTINYQLFLDSYFHRDYFKPLKYVGQTNGLLCKECPNLFWQCDETFSVSPSHSQIITSMKDGFICLVYEGQMKANGKFIIPDDSDLLRGLGLYAMAYHWLNRAHMHEDNGFQMYQTLLVQAENLLNKFRGSSILQRVRLDLISSINGTGTKESKLLREGSRKYRGWIR